MTNDIDMNGSDLLPDAAHEATTARLLQLAGMRAEVPADRADRVRRRFLDECRAVSRTRQVRTRAIAAGTLLAAAAAAMVAIQVWPSREVAAPVVDVVVATVERLEGAGVRVTALNAAEPIPLGLADAVRAGDRIDTGPTARVGLRLPDGVSVRLDRGSRARLESATRVELQAGTVYVDSGPVSPDLEVRTSFGVVRDIGTQFEIRVSDSSLRVRVRSGVVEVHRGDQVHAARPGTELTVNAGGATSRAVAPYGSDWSWAASLAPEFDIDGRPLAAFLEYLCREQGWTLGYADATLGREASGIILHGSTEGLEPDDALAVVLATTGLAHRFRDGELRVTRMSQP